MTRPCDQCPFRTDCRKGWLGEVRSTQIADELLADGSFPCHKTVDYDAENCDRVLSNPDEQHCAGALIMLEHMDHPNQWMRIMERLRLYDRTKLDMAAPVFSDTDEFIAHHSEG